MKHISQLHSSFEDFIKESSTTSTSDLIHEAISKLEPTRQMEILKNLVKEFAKTQEFAEPNFNFYKTMHGNKLAQVGFESLRLDGGEGTLKMAITFVTKKDRQIVKDALTSTVNSISCANDWSGEPIEITEYTAQKKSYYLLGQFITLLQHYKIDALSMIPELHSLRGQFLANDLNV